MNMISPQDAFQRVVTACSPIAPREMPLCEAAGLLLAENIVADWDFPPFPRAMMDGFAVRLADADKRGTINGTILVKWQRMHFVPAQCKASVTIPGAWQVRPLPTVSSADFFSCTTANCFIEAPPREKLWPGGSTMSCHWFLNQGR
jgi:molybdopterin biosynthesis enzyme